MIFLKEGTAFDIELQLFILNIYMKNTKNKVINVKRAINVVCCVGSVEIEIEIEKLKVAVTTYMHGIRGLTFRAKSLRQRLNV